MDAGEFFGGEDWSGRLSGRATAAWQELLSAALYRPWFDRVALSSLVDWALPLSRAWAAGLVADGSAERFLAQLPGVDTVLPLTALLRRLRGDRQRYDEAERTWRAAFFGRTAGRSDLADLQRQRLAAAVRLQTARSYFLPLRLATRLPAVRFEIATPAEVGQRHGERLAHPERAFALPDAAPAPEVSSDYEDRGVRHRWLRFAAPTMAGDVAWARIAEPAAQSPWATLILLHGIGVDSEFWPDPRGFGRRAAELGIRLVQPEGPWHGRRRAEGFYGGEPVLARGPLGMLDYLHAAVVEAGLLIRWAHTRGPGPVALGGISLGALTTQAAGAACAQWTDDARPDAMLLIAPGGDFVKISLQSALPRELGVPAELRRHGWSTDRLAHWLPLAGADQAPAIPPARIVAALGSADEITHIPEAQAMLHRWQVPDDNVFVAEKGHFSLSLDVHGLRRPLERLLYLLRTA